MEQAQKTQERVKRKAQKDARVGIFPNPFTLERNEWPLDNAQGNWFPKLIDTRLTPLFCRMQVEVKKCGVVKT